METPIQESAQPRADATPTAPATVASRAEFEFGESENRVFASLASKMNFVGLFSLAVGVFVIVLGILLDHHGPILSGALYALIGIWTQRASVSFGNIAATQGRDISHLMHALNDLKRLYTVQLWICCLSLIGATVALAVLMMWR